MKSGTVLLTGCAGFIGSKVTEACPLILAFDCGATASDGLLFQHPHVYLGIASLS